MGERRLALTFPSRRRALSIPAPPPSRHGACCQVLDVGANLFIGNLDPDVDEKLLYDTFSAFGGISGAPKVRVRSRPPWRN